MHHETQLSNEMKALMDQLPSNTAPQPGSELTDEMEQVTAIRQLGPTGRFPDGKLTENDEGELVFTVGVLKRKVVISFGSPVASIGLSPSQAVALAKSLQAHARQARRAGRKR